MDAKYFNDPEIGNLYELLQVVEHFYDQRYFILHAFIVEQYLAILTSNKRMFVTMKDV